MIWFLFQIPKWIGITGQSKSILRFEGGQNWGWTRMDPWWVLVNQVQNFCFGKNSLCFKRIYLFLKFNFIIIRHIDLNWLKHDSIWSLILSWILILHVFYGLENEVRYKAIYFAFRSQINLILYIFLYILYYMMKLCIKMHLLRNYNF